MKHLNFYENFKIQRTCQNFGIKNYTINEDGTVDVEGDVILSGKKLNELPLKFGRVSGQFNCDNNKLTTLKDVPSFVGGSFNCSWNKLTTLKSAPNKVGEDFLCAQNELTTLDGAPNEIGGNFVCSGNNLTTLECAPNSVDGDFNCRGNELTTLKGAPAKVRDSFYCTNNKLTSLKYAPRSVDIFDCSNNINASGYSGDPQVIDNYNKILTLEWAPVCNMLFCKGNPVWLIWKLFENLEKIELFNDIDPIHDDKIILDRLNYFLDVIDKPPVTVEQIEELEKYYKIIQ